MRFFEGWHSICISILAVIIMFSIIGALFIGISMKVMEHDTNIIKTECYDKFGNEINNVTCDKKILCNYKWDFLNYDECKNGKEE